MSDDLADQVTTAELEARLVLLKQIKESAESTLVTSYLKDLAAAYALTVGAKFGELPGGGIDVKVSK
ncbi:Uncharacterised protein [Mycobacteroides abscessus subsp. bolletii]|uniref:hypothetical protein n=1 Tax=Mycobacteroides abscessus TaxID=36809 RepID=UPI0009A88AC0|nr:hypothetical protein [Mycobacteroides abscessus]SKV05525.1 Uncharacterised protein [Mycobacteroides abscessus subsp. bolletii]